MSAIVLLFLLGVVLLAVDVFVSSFLLAAVGGVAMLIGCASTYRHFGAFDAGLAVLAALALLSATLYLELIVLPRTRLGKGLVVHSTDHAVSQPPLAQAGAVVGKAAEALTTLAPSGYVLVEGRRYEAFCRSGHAAKGEPLHVIGVDNFRLIVSKS